MTDVTMAGSLPGDVKYSNVEDVRARLVEDPAALVYAVVALDAVKVTTKTDDGEMTPTLRVRRIEVADSAGDREEISKLLARLSEARLGALPLAETADEPEQ